MATAAGKWRVATVVLLVVACPTEQSSGRGGFWVSLAVVVWLGSGVSSGEEQY